MSFKRRLLRSAFTQAHTFSIGFKSGLYGGSRKTVCPNKHFNYIIISFLKKTRKYLDLKGHQDLNLNSLMATEDGRKRAWLGIGGGIFDLSENSASARMLAEYIKQRLDLGINI